MLKLILSLAVLCLTSESFANDRDQWLKVTAVDAVIEQSGGQYDNEMKEQFLAGAKVLTHTEAEDFPEINNVMDDKMYVQVDLDDCVIDVAIVIIDPQTGTHSEVLFIDYSERY